MTTLLTFNAEGDVLQPAFYVAGKCYQKRWVAACRRSPFPKGVTKAVLDTVHAFPTKCGVASTEAHKIALRDAVFAPARKAIGSDSTAGLIIDCCKQHGITIKWDEDGFGFEIAEWLQDLCDEFDFVLLPLPHNTRFVECLHLKTCAYMCEFKYTRVSAVHAGRSPNHPFSFFLLAHTYHRQTLAYLDC